MQPRRGSRTSRTSCPGSCSSTRTSVRLLDEVDPSQAAQTGRELRRLRAFAARLRAREQGGTRFTAEQAESLGAEAQSRAEAIAGQVSQAAAQLGIELKA